MISTAPAQSSSAATNESNLGFLADHASHDVVTTILSELGGPTPVVELGGIGQALKVLGPDTTAAIVVVDITDSPDGLGDVSAMLSVLSPVSKVIVVGEANDIGLYRNLMALGCVDYLVKPIDRRTLRTVVNSALKPAGTVDDPTKLAKITVFFGARGGIGASTAAAATAAILAQEHRRRVALVDLDLHFGTISLNLGLDATSGLREALERPERLDPLFIERAMVKVGDGLFVLSSEEPLSQAMMFDPSSLRALLAMMQQSFDVVIIDVPRGMGPLQRHALSIADQIVVMSEMSLSGVRDCLRVKAFLKDAEVNGRTLYVASHLRGDKVASVRAKEFSQTVGEKIAITVPRDDATVAAANGAGKPINEVAKSGRMTRAVRMLAQELDGGPPPKQRFAPFWARWMSAKKK